MIETKLKSSTGKEITFISSFGGSKPTVVMNAFGLDTSGKSRFAMTGPEVIGIVPLDRKTRRTVEKTAKELNKRFLMPKDDLILPISPIRLQGMDDKKIMALYSEHMEKVKAAIFTLHAHSDVQTISIDLATQLYTYICYSHYGREMATIRVGGELRKDRGAANQDMRDLINAISDKHVILTHQCRAEYVNNAPTGWNTNDGYPHLGHACNVSVEFINNSKWNPNIPESAPAYGDVSWHYGIRVKRCQEMPELEGKEIVLTDDNVNFLCLANLMWPTEDPEQFL